MPALTAGQYVKATDGTHVDTEGTTLGLTIPMLLSSTTVDMNEGTMAKQPLYTCPANRRCVVTDIVLQKWSANPTEENGAIFSIGWNVAADDVVGVTTTFSVGGATIAALLKIPNVGTVAYYLSRFPVIGTPADILGLIVSAPEGSALTVKVDVFGYWTDTNGVPIANVVGTAP